TKGVRAGNDDPIINAEFEESIAAGADLRDELFMRNGDLAILVAALLLIGNLILDLQSAGACLDHLLSEEIGRLGIAETCINGGDDRNNVGFVVVDGVNQLLLTERVAGLARFIQLAEHHAELTGTRLTQEGVKLLPQRWNAGLFVHGLVRKRAEFGAQCRNHPAGKIEIATLGGAKMLLDGDHLLLADKAVPAAERLRVVGRISLICRHVTTHDASSIAG